MRKVSVFSKVTLTILLYFAFAAVVQAKDINLGLVRYRELDHAAVRCRQ